MKRFIVCFLLMVGAGCDDDDSAKFKRACQAAGDSWDECEPGCPSTATCEAWVTDCAVAETDPACLGDCVELDCDERIDCLIDCYAAEWE